MSHLLHMWLKTYYYDFSTEMLRQVDTFVTRMQEDGYVHLAKRLVKAKLYALGAKLQDTKSPPKVSLTCTHICHMSECNIIFVSLEIGTSGLVHGHQQG